MVFNNDRKPNMPQQQEHQPNNANPLPICTLSSIIFWGGVMLLLLSSYTSSNTATTELENSGGSSNDLGSRNDVFQFFKNTAPRKMNTGATGIHVAGDVTIKDSTIAGGDLTINNARETQSGGSGVHVRGGLTINGKKFPTKFSTEGLFSDGLMQVNDEITARKGDQLITVHGKNAVIIDGHFIVDGIEVTDDDSRIIHIDNIGQRSGRNP